MGSPVVPPLPPGFKLDAQNIPPLPQGFTLDSQPKPTEERTAAGFLNNVGTSAKNMVVGVAKGLTVNLPETLATIGAVPLGVYEKSGLPLPDALKDKKSAATLDAIGKFYTDRYGSLEAFKKAAYEDPVGVLADAATVLGGAGAITRAAGTAAKVGALEQAGTALVKAGGAVDPIAATGRAVSAAGGGRVANAVAEKAYKSALKPSTTLTIEEANKAVRTGLNEGIAISESGFSKLRDTVDAINLHIKGLINKADASGKAFPPTKAAAYADATAQKFANQVAPSDDLAAIASKKNDFLAQFQQGQPAQLLNAQGKPIATAPQYRDIGVLEAQEMKQGTYRALGDRAYGETKGAAIETEKAIARGLKDSIAQIIPEISGLNARESSLLKLGDLLERAVRRTSNHNMVSLGTQVLSGSGNPSLAFVNQIFSGAPIKSHLAIMLYKAQKATPGVTPSWKAATARANEVIDAVKEQTAAIGSSEPNQLQ